VLTGLLAAGHGPVVAGAEEGEKEMAPSPRLRFHAPRVSRPIEIAGRIDPEAWAQAAALRGGAVDERPDMLEGQLRRWIRTGPSIRHAPGRFEGGPRFWFAWDAEHLYLAARSRVDPEVGLVADDRGAGAVPVLDHDDRYTFALDLSRVAGARRQGVLMSSVNPLGVARHHHFASDFKPNAKIEPVAIEPEVASAVWTDDSGRRWWDVQVGYDRADLALARPLAPGARVGVNLARVRSFPWRRQGLPTAGHYMDGAGFPVARLTRAAPYVRVARLAGPGEGPARFEAEVHNPGERPRRFEAGLRVAPEGQETEEAEGPPAHRHTFEVAAGGRARLALGGGEAPREAATLEAWVRAAEGGAVIHAERLALRPGAAEAGFLDFDPDFGAAPMAVVAFDPGTETARLEGDGYAPRGRSGGPVDALSYAVRAAGGGRTWIEGAGDRVSGRRVWASMDLAPLPPGTYVIEAALFDAAGQTLARRTLPGFEKIVAAGGRFRYRWTFAVRVDAGALARLPALRDLAPVTGRVNRWVREGRAAGHTGDFYHNHDHLHSYLALERFPQLTPVDATWARRSLPGAGLQVRKHFTGRVIGNASMVVGGEAYPAYAYRRPDRVAALYEQYTGNHLYLYVSFRTRPEDYPAYTPYVVATAGASGSEQRIMEALFAALAAMRPDVKAHLTETGRIAPVLQRLLRRHYEGVETEADYLTARAHPVVFHGGKIDLEGMVQGAQAMTRGGIPPGVRLEILGEDAGAAARFTTPAAIARTLHAGGAALAMRVRAAPAAAPEGPPLRWRWVVLRGDPARTRIQTSGPGGREAALHIDPQPGRVDIGVFAARADSGWSAPAIISVETAEGAARGAGGEAGGENP